MLATVELDVKELGDALDSVQDVLIPWLEQHDPNELTEEEKEREYVKLALEVIKKYNPSLDEDGEAYYVFKLVPVIAALAESPYLKNTVNNLVGGYLFKPTFQQSPIASKNVLRDEAIEAYRLALDEIEGVIVSERGLTHKKVKLHNLVRVLGDSSSWEQSDSETEEEFQKEEKGDV